MAAREEAAGVAWLALGCNIGHRGRALACMRTALEERGLRIEAASTELWTRAVGVTSQPDFHNQVLKVRSPEALAAPAWLRTCKEVEVHCGRRFSYHWGPRAADVDIILLGESGEVVAEVDPVVPHPEIAKRLFWQELLAEIGGPVTR